MEQSLIEGVESLQERVANHKKLIREVDNSLKRLSGNGNERNIRLDTPRNGLSGNGNERNIRLDTQARNGLSGNGNERNIRLDTPRNGHNLNRTIPQMADNSRQRDSGRPGQLTRKISLGSDFIDNRFEEADRSMKRKSYEGQQHHVSAKRVVNSAINYTSQPDPESGDEDRQRVKSSVVSSTMPIKTKEDLIKIQNKGVNVQRNKRIFGHLLGTLSQFKNDDQVRSSTTQAIHRKELEAKIEINKAEEIKRLAEEKKRLEEERVRQGQILELLESKVRVTQEFESWKQDQLRYKKFIRTKTRPYLFYMPRQMNEHTSKLVQETAALIDDQIAKKLKETTGELEALKRKEDQLNKETKPSELVNNKENKEGKNQTADDTFDKDDMDEDKDSVNNVQLGDDAEEYDFDKDEANNNTSSTVLVESEKMSQENELPATNTSESDKGTDVSADGMED